MCLMLYKTLIFNRMWCTYLSDCMKRANVKSVSDMQNISLALQGYNFGNGYIEWAVEHFGGYTRPNAKVFQMK